MLRREKGSVTPLSPGEVFTNSARKRDVGRPKSFLERGRPPLLISASSVSGIGRSLAVRYLTEPSSRSSGRGEGFFCALSFPRKGLAMPDVPPLADFGALSATAVLGWYAWHTANHMIPELVRAFREETAAQRAECAAEREALHAELVEQRRATRRSAALGTGRGRSRGAAAGPLERAAQTTNIHLAWEHRR